MKLTEKEAAFVETRDRLVRVWPIAGWLMIVLLLGTSLWLFIFNPLLANPIHVMARLEDGTLPASSLIVMAAILPFLTLTTLGICLILVIFAFTSMRRERKYIELIRALIKSSEKKRSEDV